MDSRGFQPGGTGGVVGDRVSVAVDHGRALVRSFDPAVVGPGRARRRNREASSLSVHASIPPILDCVVAAVS